MNLRKQIVEERKKTILGAALGTLLGASVAIILFLLSGQSLYLAIIGLGAGIGFSVGGGFDR